MTPDLLEQAASAVYGNFWPAALARDMGVSRRTVVRWRDGETKPPRALGKHLLARSRQQQAILDVVVLDLETAACSDLSDVGGEA